MVTHQCKPGYIGSSKTPKDPFCKSIRDERVVWGALHSWIGMWEDDLSSHDRSKSN